MKKTVLFIFSSQTDISYSLTKSGKITKISKAPFEEAEIRSRMNAHLSSWNNNQ
jgi:hypothetical protein